jgi:hypothetical protein
MLHSIDSTQALIQLHQLRNAIIDLQFKEDPFFKTYGSLFISLMIVAITIGGQIYIFRLTKNKELELFKINRQKEVTIKVAELYGKYKALQINFVLIFHDYGVSNVNYKYSFYMWEYYNNKVEDEDYELKEGESAEELYMLRNGFLKAKDECVLIDKDNYERYRTIKLQITELLHQIHFYYKDETLSALITQFHNKLIYMFPFTRYDKSMKRPNYLSHMIRDNVSPAWRELETIGKSITTRILELS